MAAYTEVGTADPSVLLEQQITTDHATLSEPQNMTNAASRKSASGAAQGDQAIVPPSKSKPDMSDQHSKGSTASQRKHSKYKRFKAMWAINTLDAD